MSIKFFAILHNKFTWFVNLTTGELDFSTNARFLVNRIGVWRQMIWAKGGLAVDHLTRMVIGLVHRF